jgi:hypothetical protein
MFMSSEFRKKKTELVENGNFRLFAANGNGDSKLPLFAANGCGKRPAKQ